MGRVSLVASQIPAAPPPPAAQNPSPMVEQTRAHEGLAPMELRGVTRSFAGPAGKPVELFVPDGVRTSDMVDLVVHFLGAPWLPEQAVARLGGHTVAAVVNLGTGCGAYHRAFADPAAFDSLLAGVARDVSTAIGRTARSGRVTLGGLSACLAALRELVP